MFLATKMQMMLHLLEEIVYFRQFCYLCHGGFLKAAELRSGLKSFPTKLNDMPKFLENWPTKTHHDEENKPAARHDSAVFLPTMI